MRTAFWFCASFLALATAAPVISVTVNKSAVIDCPEAITRVSTSNPAVVDYVLVSPTEILVHGKSLGSASIVVWGKSGQRVFHDISVEPDIGSLQTLVNATFPDEKVELHAARDSISVSGLVSSQAIADRAAALLTPAAKSVVNNLRIKPAPVDKQILLRVRFAEVNRSNLKELGVSIFSTGATNTIGTITTGRPPGARPSDVTGVIGGKLPGTATTFTLSDALNILAFRPDLNIGVMIRALQQQGYLQILAEPNLVTSNGKEASFLVGGEFPVPVLQAGASSGAITVQFREFGIRLSFLPRLTENGTLKMDVKPEVSTIDVSNAVTLGGFTIPALSTRRISSTIELAAGQSFVIGGLVDDRVTETLMRIPGLASIPLLGNLFKSRQENKTKTELLVLVTPELVEPLAPGDAMIAAKPPREMLPPVMLPSPATKLQESKGTTKAPSR